MPQKKIAMNTSIEKAPRSRLGIIGGVGALGAADLYFKIARQLGATRTGQEHQILLEQRPFPGYDAPHERPADLVGRKLYVFDMVKQFEARGMTAVLLPCFVSHTFLGEIQAESGPPVINIMEALLDHLERESDKAGPIGILTSNAVRNSRLFETWFERLGRPLVFSDDALQRDCVMQAIYGPEGIKAGNVGTQILELLHQACQDLMARGAKVIVAGATEIAVMSDALRGLGVPIIDSNAVYAEYALTHTPLLRPRPFRVGILGGVGPAATVDFMSKIVQGTDARRDQDHIKLVVEHNPQIPDRTANLIGNGEDPTIAIYSACKRLESNDADLIAIPCNTAHAFVDRIQPYLSIPILNMLRETVSHISRQLPGAKKVGLLATSGTVKSRVYHEAAKDASFELLVPDEAHQEAVMRAIYGERGVKAGYVDGECKADLMIALRHLVARGAEAIVLGCTELPLIISSTPDMVVDDKHVAIFDPTEILAHRCVQISKSSRRTNTPDATIQGDMHACQDFNRSHRTVVAADCGSSGKEYAG